VNNSWTFFISKASFCSLSLITPRPPFDLGFVINFHAASDERLVPDLSRSKCKSIDGDLDVDEEGSEQNGRNLAITIPHLCWLPTCEHTSWTHQEG
jgi:hypothetical protein